MDNSHDNLADAIYNAIQKALKRRDAPVAKVYMGVFVAVESSDANLSQVTLVDGSICRNVPKADNIGSLSSGDALLMIRGPQTPLTILCRPTGDISNPTAS